MIHEFFYLISITAIFPLQLLLAVLAGLLLLYLCWIKRKKRKGEKHLDTLKRAGPESAKEVVDKIKKAVPRAMERARESIGDKVHKFKV